MKTVVLGAGALGSIIAGHLARAGEEVLHPICHSEKRSDEESRWPGLPCSIDEMRPFAALGVTAGWLVAEFLGRTLCGRNKLGSAPVWGAPSSPTSSRVSTLSDLTFSRAREKGLLAGAGTLALRWQVGLVPGQGLPHNLGEGGFRVDLIVADALQDDQFLGFSGVGE